MLVLVTWQSHDLEASQNTGNKYFFVYDVRVVK